MDEILLTQYALKVQQGDRGSFGRLVELLSRHLLAVAVRYTQDFDNAMDITQETWLKVYSHIERFDPRYSVRAWINVIHRNNCLSFLRTVQSRERIAERYAHERNRATAPPDPFADTARREFGERIRAAMLQLSESQQAVLALVAIEQMDQGDAARMLGMKHATLRSTLHFARKRLAQLLREEEETA